VSSTHEEILKEITRAISESVTDSPRVQAILNRLEGEGFNIYILLESSVGLKKNNVNLPLHREKILIKRTGGKGIQFKITGEDMEFLRRIGVDPIKKVPRREGR